jgi:hypothetical protein
MNHQTNMAGMSHHALAHCGPNSESSFLFIPDWLVRNSRISPEAKVVFGWVEWFWRVERRGPTIEELGASLGGKPAKTVRRLLQELLENGAVESVAQ